MNIFDESQSEQHSFFFPLSHEHHFLDINEYLQYQSSPHTQEPEIAQPAPQRKLSDAFGPDPVFVPFEPLRSNTLDFDPLPMEEREVFEAPRRQERVAPSIVTKNVCFNICQKTVKVIQKDLYEQKLLQICRKNGVDKTSFVTHILQQKKNFTGPKALQLYIEQENAFSRTFREFMRWFLREKYLRHCLTGDMENKEAYIRYKNEVILVILG